MNAPQKRPLALFLRVLSCLFVRKDDSAGQVRKSYDRIGDGYDLAWTNHMRSLTLELLDGLGAKVGEKALDLTCGTGFATAELARRTGTMVTGVDAAVQPVPVTAGAKLLQSDDETAAPLVPSE